MDREELNADYLTEKKVVGGLWCVCITEAQLNKQYRAVGSVCKDGQVSADSNTKGHTRLMLDLAALKMHSEC